eukprot:10996832-Ditylum_brightwellii.AAC.1
MLNNPENFTSYDTLISPLWAHYDSVEDHDPDDDSDLDDLNFTMMSLLIFPSEWEADSKNETNGKDMNNTIEALSSPFDIALTSH